MATEKNYPEKILIIQTASIGDVILATSLIESLHHTYPHAELSVLVKSNNTGLFHEHPFIKNVLAWNKQYNKYSNLFRLIKYIRRERFTIVVNIQRFFSSGIITALSGAKTTTGFTKNPLSTFFTHRIRHDITVGGKHEIERNHELISFLGQVQLQPVKLYPGTEAYKNIEQWQSEPYICIAPASLWFTKQLPAEKWIAIINKIHPDYNVHLLGGANDEPLCQQISAQSTHKRTNILAGRLNLLETAALMKKAHMNIVLDSAPLHLASAMNAPTTALFCSTVPAFGFGPLAENSTVVEPEKTLSCRPCGIHGLRKCPKKHFDCAYTINCTTVIERINNV
ncbi:MAG: glycosyltransferase family 9 protein [Bacteroidales bacterium]|nr:glycosyltransferase family 9 protein [Bacteroidales bacterium]